MDIYLSAKYPKLGNLSFSCIRQNQFFSHPNRILCLPPQQPCLSLQRFPFQYNLQLLGELWIQLQPNAFPQVSAFVNFKTLRRQPAVIAIIKSFNVFFSVFKQSVLKHCRREHNFCAKVSFHTYF